MVNQFSKLLIYLFFLFKGDTDSIMVYTGLENVEDAIKVGYTVIKEVNKQYKTLEIAIDGIYKSMLLLSKKKYATMTLQQEKENGRVVYREVKETKGLDLVRRDWCDLSKKIGSHILDLILSGKPLEESIEIVKEYIKEEGEKIRNGMVPIKDFIITKGLNKNPKGKKKKKIFLIFFFSFQKKLNKKKHILTLKSFLMFK